MKKEAEYYPLLLKKASILEQLKNGDGENSLLILMCGRARGKGNAHKGYTEVWVSVVG